MAARIANVSMLPLLAALFALSLAFAGCAADQEAIRKEAISSKQLAYAYLQEKQTARALSELAKAEAVMPDDPDIKNTMGLAYWVKREHQLAEKKFLEAVMLDPKYSEAWNNLGAFYIDQNLYDKAIPALKNALANVYYTTSERALTNLGWAYYKLGNLKEAKEKLAEAAETAPTFALAQKNLGLVLQEMGDHHSAVMRFDRTLQIFSMDQETHFAKGVSLAKLGDKAGARASFEEAWKIGPNTDVGKSAKNYADLLK